MWAVYRWESQTERLRSVDQFVELMLMKREPEKAIPTLEELTAQMKAAGIPALYDQDRYLYLLGLAYELTGNTSKAVQLYYQVWFDYPGSGYAIMARSKLEVASSE